MRVLTVAIAVLVSTTLSCADEPTTSPVRKLSTPSLAKLCQDAEASNCYEITAIEIGADLPTNAVEPLAINDRGGVIGRYVTDVVKSWVWKDGRLAEMGSLGGSSTNVMAINNHGQAVGVSFNGEELERAFLWENGTMRDLGTLGGCCSYATDINDHGEIVGTSFIDDSDTMHLFHWKDGVMTDLGLALNGEAFINDQGVIAGWGSIDGSEHGRAFRIENGRLSLLDDGGVAHWTRGLTRHGTAAIMSDLNAVIWAGERVVSTFGFPHAINSHGVVLLGNDFGTFLWDGDKLTHLADQPFGALWALNDHAAVAGGKVDANGSYRATVWLEGEFVDLGTLGGTSSIGLAIDNHGRVLGTFVRGTQEGERMGAALWTIKYRGPTGRSLHR